MGLFIRSDGHYM